MSIYSDKLTVSTCTGCYQLPIFVSQMCIREDTDARLFTCAVLDDVMSQNELTTSITPSRVLMMRCAVILPRNEMRGEITEYYFY